MKDCNTSTKLKGESGTPTTKLTEVLVNAAAIIMQKDSGLIKRELAQILQIAPCNTHVLLTEKFGLLRVCTRQIPHSLTEEQQAEHV